MLLRIGSRFIIRPWLKPAGYDYLLVNKTGYGSDVVALATPSCCDQGYEASCMSMVVGYWLLSPFRKLGQNSHELLAPYVFEA